MPASPIPVNPPHRGISLLDSLFFLSFIIISLIYIIYLDKIETGMWVFVAASFQYLICLLISDLRNTVHLLKEQSKLLDFLHDLIQTIRESIGEEKYTYIREQHFKRYSFSKEDEIQTK